MRDREAAVAELRGTVDASEEQAAEAALAQADAAIASLRGQVQALESEIRDRVLPSHVDRQLAGAVCDPPEHLLSLPAPYRCVNWSEDEASRLRGALATERRCLLAGVLIFPVTAPLVTSGESAFPRVAALTRLLRWNPLALDIADGIVASRAASVKALGEFLRDAGVTQVRALEHEDDLPEIALLIDWAWPRLSVAARRTLAVLAHVEGDHVDAVSLAKLARVARLGPPLAELERWHLVQQPVSERYTLHAVVRHAVARRTKLDADRVFSHYVTLLERHPKRLELEQSHLFAAMEHASRKNDMNALLRIEALARRLSGAQN
jgi:hypothetical protein